MQVGEDIRSFMCVTQAGPERVQIMDVLAFDGKLFLIVKGGRDEPYVFEIMYNGIRCASRENGEQALAIHIEQVKAMSGA